MSGQNAQPAPYRVLSYGGGLDSFALLLLQILIGQLPDLVVFADVADRDHKDPGEWPGTYKHVREVVMPLCADWGIEFVWLDTTLMPIRPSRNHPAGFRSLYDYYLHTGQMFGRISRVCTIAAKVDRIQRYLLRRLVPGTPVQMWIGFEAGEEGRQRRDPHGQGCGQPGWTVRYPLIEAGLCRCRGEKLIRALGFPVPRKSACVFCPFSSIGDFARLRRELPQIFEKVQVLEDRSKLTRKGMKLRYAYRNGSSDPRLTDWAARSYKRRLVRCEACGAAVRASKEVGCGYLDEAEWDPQARAAEQLRADGLSAVEIAEVLGLDPAPAVLALAA